MKSKEKEIYLNIDKEISSKKEDRATLMKAKRLSKNKDVESKYIDLRYEEFWEEIDENDWSYRLRIYDEGTTSYGNWGAWTRALNNTVSNNDQIQVRLVSSSSPSDTKNVLVTVGTGSAQWNITTGAIPVNTPNPAPDFGSLNNLPLGVLVYSDVAQILGLNTSATISVDNGAEIAVSNFNTTFTNSSGYEVLNNISSGWGNNLTVSNGQYVQLRGTSSSTPQGQINFSVTVGDGAGISVWPIVSGQGVDNNPDNFVFQDLVNQIPGQTGLRSEVSAGSSTSVAGRNVARLINLVNLLGSPVVEVNECSNFATRIGDGDSISFGTYCVSVGTFA